MPGYFFSPDTVSIRARLTGGALICVCCAQVIVETPHGQIAVADLYLTEFRLVLICDQKVGKVDGWPWGCASKRVSV